MFLTNNLTWASPFWLLKIGAFMPVPGRYYECNCGQNTIRLSIDSWCAMTANFIKYALR